jgi:hypothetical protein
MGVVVAVLLCLAAFGSLMWVMPSQREKQLTELRRQAMQRGLRVRLLDQGLQKAYFRWLGDHRGLVLYERQCSLASAGRHEFAPMVVRLPITEEDDQILSRALMVDTKWIDSLPEGAEALLIHPSGVALLWRERLGDVLSRHAQQIEHCVAAISDVLDHLAKVTLALDLRPVDSA